MHIQNRFFALIFRGILATGCLYGLFLNSGLPGGSFKPEMFVFYTILSNAVCFFYFLPLTVMTAMDLPTEGKTGTTALLPRFKGAVTMMIVVTMLIYHFLLAPRQFSMENADFWKLSNLLAHYFTPLMAVLDWLLFDRKNAFQKFDPLLWLFIPYLYFVFALIRARFGGIITLTGSRYPYFFIDVDALGWQGVVRWLVPITAFFLVLGYAIYMIDRFVLSKKSS